MKTEQTLLKRIAKKIVRLFYLMWLQIKSFLLSIKASFIPDRLLIDQPYQGQKILLIALFEKGTLRPDIQRLLRCAKSKGYFVMGINTLRLSSPEKLTDLFDCYLERFNYARDFGSYKTGFMRIFKHDYALTCPRLLLLNDSVFYESSRTPCFLDEMMNSEVEVLAATENFHEQHHVGSFCISMAGNVLRHPIHKRFWQQYRLTEVRPLIIKKGELGLSQALKRAVREQDGFCALYDINRFTEYLDSTPEFIEQAYQYTCASGRKSRLSSEETWRKFLTFSHQENQIKSPGSLLSDPALKSKYHSFIKATTIHAFMQGSQIHTNAVVMMHLGLPLVKLDGVYRGAMSIENVLAICHLLSSEEAAELKRLLLNRPYGSETLPLFPRLMFECGYL